MDVIGLAGTLIGIPSPTGEEGALADALVALLGGLGFRVLEQPVGAAPRRNVFATLGPRPRVVLCTHMDTVPGEARAREDEDFLYGRGSCDAKGIMAAMIAAAAGLVSAGRRDFGLLFVVGEETDSLGAKTANALAPGSRYLIVGEPTGNVLGSGHLGILTVALTARGKRIHSAFPHLGESAVEKLLDVVGDLRRIAFPADPALGPTRTSVVQFDGGEAPNVIPDRARAVVSLRTGVSPNALLERIRTAVDGRAEIEIISKSEPQTLFVPPGYPSAVMPFGSDIPHLKAFGAPLLVGPGSALDAHTAGEKIDKRQLGEAVALYARLVEELGREAP
jgi:acetylornithine deacetylase